MKKLISALCALMLAVSLAACSRGPAEHGGLLPLDPTDPPATEEPTAAAWGVTPDAAGEAELTRSCVLVRDAVGFWHPAAVENV